MKISLGNLAPALEIITHWMDSDQNESGISFSHHDSKVIVTAYSFSSCLEMLAIELDTYDFEPFKPFGLARNASEVILSRAVFSGIHQFEDVILDGVRALRLSGIGSNYTCKAQFVPTATDLPDFAAKPSVWLAAEYFERANESFKSFSHGPLMTETGIRIQGNAKTKFAQLDAAHEALMGTMVIECSRVDNEDACQFHMPPWDIARLLSLKGSGQVAIAKGSVSSGNYSYHSTPTFGSPDYELARSKEPDDDHAIVALVELRELKQILGLDMEGHVSLTLDISRSFLTDFSASESDIHLGRVMGEAIKNHNHGESTVLLDRKILNQAWEVLGHAGLIQVAMGTSFDPVVIAHRGGFIPKNIRSIRVMIMPMMQSK